jgi:N,N'-diacetyllegionaminate synthase
VAGTALTADKLALKKPGTGIPAARLKSVIGRVLKRAVEKDKPLQEEDLL